MIGAGVAVDGIGYEILVACENLKDIQRMQQECGVEEAVEKGIMDAVCNKLP